MSRNAIESGEVFALGSDDATTCVILLVSARSNGKLVGACCMHISSTNEARGATALLSTWAEDEGLRKLVGLSMDFDLVGAFNYKVQEKEEEEEEEAETEVEAREKEEERLVDVVISSCMALTLCDSTAASASAAATSSSAYPCRFRCLAVGPRNRSRLGLPRTQGAALLVQSGQLVPAHWRGGRWPLAASLVRSAAIQFAGKLVKTRVTCENDTNIVAQLQLDPSLLDLASYDEKTGLGGLFWYIQKALSLPRGLDFIKFTSTSPECEQQRFENDVRSCLAFLAMIVLLHVQGVQLLAQLINNDGQPSRVLLFLSERADRSSRTSGFGEIKAAIADVVPLLKSKEEESAVSTAAGLVSTWIDGKWV